MSTDRHMKIIPLKIAVVVGISWGFLSLSMLRFPLLNIDPETMAGTPYVIILLPVVSAQIIWDILELPDTIALMIILPIIMGGIFMIIIRIFYNFIVSNKAQGNIKNDK